MFGVVQGMLLDVQAAPERAPKLIQVAAFTERG